MSHSIFSQKYISRQHGVVLFLALIALVAMSLAAVALIRSVDTGTLIAGNLAFKQGTITSGDSGPEGAIAWLSDKTAMNPSDPRVDPLHPLNNDNPSAGYYSSINEAAPLDLFAASIWSAGTSVPAGGKLYDAQGKEYYDLALTKPTGNSVRYIIQRMCRTPNQLLSETECLFGGTVDDGMSRSIDDKYQPPPDANLAGSPIYRVTARVEGPKNTVSYIQAYVY